MRGYAFSRWIYLQIIYIPFDREERWTILKDWDDEVFDFLDGKDDVVYEYEGIFEDVFVHEHPELFVFDGTYTVSE